MFDRTRIKFKESTANGIGHMRNATLIALLLLAGISSASAESASKEKVKLPRLPAQEVIDAQNNASREINKLRLRALVGQIPPNQPMGPAGGIPFIPIK
jgi:hypothetical protein